MAELSTTSEKNVLRKLADALRQASRNGKWGTCGGCPRDTHGNAYPEFCECRDRYDHHLTIDQLADAWKRYLKSENDKEQNNG